MCGRAGMCVGGCVCVGGMGGYVWEGWDVFGRDGMCVGGMGCVCGRAGGICTKRDRF